MKKIAILLSTISLYMFPMFVFAAERISSIQGVLSLINGLIKIVVPILIAAAVAWFLWGVLKYIIASGDEEKRKEGKSVMVYGIIALAIMVSVWGLVRIITGTFNLDTSAPIEDIKNLVR